MKKNKLALRSNHRIPWYKEFVTPQTIVYIGVAIVGAVTFALRQKEHTEKIIKLEQEIEEMKKNKADVADVNAVSERVSRQYESIGKLNERANKADQDAAYQKGLHDKSENK